MPGFQKTVYLNEYYLSTIKWLIFHFITYLISNIKYFHGKWVSAFRGRKMHLIGHMSWGFMCAEKGIRRSSFCSEWSGHSGAGIVLFCISIKSISFSPWSKWNIIFKTGYKREMFWISLMTLKWKTSHCGVARRYLILIGQSQTGWTSSLSSS